MSEAPNADELTNGTEIIYQKPNHSVLDDRDYDETVRGTIVDTAEETKHLVSSKIEQTLIIVETDEGEEKRINIKNLTGDTEWRVSIVPEEADDNNDDEREDDDCEVVADGGEDVTEHVDDSTIEDAIEQHDDPDHPDAMTVDEVRDHLAQFQRGVAASWNEWMDNIERDDARIVQEDDDLIVLDTGEHNVVTEDLELVYDDGLDHIEQSVISAVVHAVAEEYTDHDWSVSNPAVLVKPTRTNNGRAFVEGAVNQLVRRGLPRGQAWAYYGVKIRGYSRNYWAKRMGYSDHSAISQSVRSAEEKLTK